MYNLKIDGREAGRILSALRERLKKLNKSIERWGDDFDPIKGAHILDARNSYQALIHNLQEQML